jgi:hypothetical protein
MPVHEILASKDIGDLLFLLAAFFTIVAVVCAFYVRTYCLEHGWFMGFLFVANSLALVVFAAHAWLVMFHLFVLRSQRGAEATFKVFVVTGTILFVGHVIYGVVTAVVVLGRRVHDHFLQGMLSD